MVISKRDLPLHQKYISFQFTSKTEMEYQINTDPFAISTAKHGSCSSDSKPNHGMEALKTS